MIRAPGGSVCFMMFLLLFFRWRSKAFGLAVLLPFKLRLFREPVCKIVCFEQRVCLESGQCVSQDMILPKYCFATISFCQSMILPKYHFAKVLFCHNIILPKYHVAKILFCLNINFPKYCDAQWSSWVLPKIRLPEFVCKMIGRKVRKITIWVVPKPHILNNLQGWWSHWDRRPLWW